MQIRTEINGAMLRRTGQRIKTSTCYSLKVKCLPQVHGLDPRSQADDTVQEGYEIF